MPTFFPISSSSSSSSAQFLPSSSSSNYFFFFFFSGGGGARRTSSSSSSSSSSHLLLTPTNTNTIIIFNSSSSSSSSLKTLANNNYYPSKQKQQQQQQLLFSVTSSSSSSFNNSNSSNFDIPPPPPPAEDENNNNNKNDDDVDEDPGISDYSETTTTPKSDDGVDIEIEKIGNNSRRIRSRISIDATLETVWGLLTDYEGLSDFIPGLSVSQLIEKRHNFAKIFQIGQQNLAFGVNFNAKGIVDCYEKDLETLPFGRRKRDIDFKMVQGDFQTFQGKWSIEETCSTDRPDVDQISGGGECHTTTVTLSYIVDVTPKLWLPVGLVEGRLCREVSLNLVCIREEAQKKVNNTLPTC